MTTESAPFHLPNLDAVRSALQPFSLEPQQAPQAVLHDYLQYYGFFTDFEPCSHALGYLDLADYRIATHYWRVPGSAKATVLVLHGLFDHVGLFLPLVRVLIKSGYDVLAIDLPGHGLSSGKRAEIRAFSHYSAVIGALLTGLANETRGTYLVAAQSTGCAVIMDYQFQQSNPCIAGAVLFAPLVRVYAWSAIRLAHTVLSPFVKSVPRSFHVNSHDEQFNQQLRADPLQARHLPVSWVRAMLAWGNSFDAQPVQDQLPVLVLQGSSDTTVDFRRNWPRLKARFPSAQRVMIDGAMHHLVGEAPSWRDPAFAEMLHFFDAIVVSLMGPQNNV